MCVHTVIRCTLNRRQIETTLSPFARAVRIASTWLSVRGVLARLLGFATTPGSSWAAPTGSSSRTSFARFHAELSRSNLCQVFGLSPPASTNSRGSLAGAFRRLRGQSAPSRDGCRRSGTLSRHSMPRVAATRMRGWSVASAARPVRSGACDLQALRR